MSRVQAKFSGGVVAEPERKNVAGNDVLEFPVYVNHQKKNRDTGEYERTGDTTKIRVSLWRDAANQDIRKGDVVEVEASIVEKEFTKRDGTEGRQLQTEFVDSVVVKWRGDGGGGGGQSAGAGFGGNAAGGGFGGSEGGGFGSMAF